MPVLDLSCVPDPNDSGERWCCGKSSVELVRELPMYFIHLFPVSATVHIAQQNDAHTMVTMVTYVECSQFYYTSCSKCIHT